MKKIMITLCTLLAVGSGKYIDAAPGFGEPVKVKVPEKGRAEVAEAGRSGKGGKPETGRPDAPEYVQAKAANKDVQAKAAKTAKLLESKSGSRGAVIDQNLNIIKDMHGVKSSPAKQDGNPYNQTFNLSNKSEMTIDFDTNGNPKESIITEYEMKKNRKGISEITAKRVTNKMKYNRDGSMNESIFNKEGKVTQEIRYKKDGTFDITNIDAYGKDLDFTSYDKSGKATEFSDYRTKAEQTTPEQRSQAEARADKAAESAQKVKDNTAERESQVDKTANEVSKALENGDEAGVRKSVTELAENVMPKDIPAGQKSTIIEQITAKIMEIGRSGKEALTTTLESIRSVINSVLDTIATGQFRTSAHEVGGEGTNNQAEPSLFNNGVKKNENYGDVLRSESPTGVDKFESLNELENEKRVTSTEPKTTVLFRAH